MIPKKAQEILDFWFKETPSEKRFKKDEAFDQTIKDKFLNDYKLFGPPAILFFNTDGDEYKEARIVGFVDANEFIEKYQRTGESVISFKKN